MTTMRKGADRNLGTRAFGDEEPQSLKGKLCATRLDPPHGVVCHVWGSRVAHIAKMRDVCASRLLLPMAGYMLAWQLRFSSLLKGNPLASQALIPPARSDTLLIPCSLRRLAPIEDRYPLAHCITNLFP